MLPHARLPPYTTQPANNAGGIPNYLESAGTYSEVRSGWPSHNYGFEYKFGEPMTSEYVNDADVIRIPSRRH